MFDLSGIKIVVDLVRDACDWDQLNIKSTGTSATSTNLDKANENTDSIANLLDSISTKIEENSSINTEKLEDQNYSDIDYNLSPFKEALNDGKKISGWWTIEEKNAAIDDSPIVIAENHSEYTNSDSRIRKKILIRCEEGVTTILFNVKRIIFLFGSSRSQSVIYRIDVQPAQKFEFHGIDNGIGLNGLEAIEFIKRIENARKLFIRPNDESDSKDDSLFDLSGIKIVVDLVKNACNW